MKIITLPVSDLHPADYNPRKDLAPGDKQYEKLARSIETFGYVEPIVWNRTTGNIVGGHQRLKVLVQKGYTEVQVVEVELNEQEERILNVSLNKISGRWDNEKLTAILDELKEQGEMSLTGFDDWELDALKVTYDHSHIERDESVDGLRSFIEGKRGNETEWCDWNIPIHWGGMSDPFQPVEKQIRASYECLKLLAETKYPFVVSTKGRLVADPEYLDLLAQCNCVLQISMVCSKYDRLERGTPSYEERLAILKTVSARVQRTIVRIQPYMPEVFHDVMKNIPRIAEAGAYGVIVEGMKFFKAKPGMTKIGGDFCYPLPRLRHDFEAIKAECHRYGLKFYSGENRLRAMGDSMTCCGIDGLPGFRPNEYNLCMLMNGKNPEPTEKMKEVGTGGPFKTLNQSAGSGRKIAKQSFYGLMQEELAKKTDYHRKVFGLDE